MKRSRSGGATSICRRDSGPSNVVAGSRGRRRTAQELWTRLLAWPMPSTAGRPTPKCRPLASGREVSALVFASEAATPLDDVNVGRRFRETSIRAGLPRFSIYSLRPAYASHLLGMGAPTTYVANQMGQCEANLDARALRSFPSAW